MEESNKKFITLSFVGAAMLVAYIVSVILDLSARTFGIAARYLSNDMFQHGLPVACGLVTFLFLQFNPKTVQWADEVIVEVRKVVWPSQKDTMAMTIVVTIMLILSGVFLGVFDLMSSSLVKAIIG